MIGSRDPRVESSRTPLAHQQTWEWRQFASEARAAGRQSAITRNLQSI